MSKPVFGYWDIRGLGQQHRLLLTYLGVDFEDKRYGFDSGPDSWFEDKPNLSLDFPNLPYWIDDLNQIKLTESKAILRYIAKTRGGGSLYPETPELQAIADMVDGVVTDLQRALAIVAYSATGVPDVPLEEAQAEKFTQLNEFLGKKHWSVSDSISFVDFFVYEVLKKYMKYNEEFLKPYPALTKYMEKFESLPQLVEYIRSSEKILSYAPFAKLKF